MTQDNGKWWIGNSDIDPLEDSDENGAGLYAKVRCWLGRPRCHRHVKSGIDYACCDYCHRQTEVHERFDRNWLGPQWTRPTPPAEKGLPADWERRHRVTPPDAPPVQGATYRCVRCDRESVGGYPTGECVIPPAEKGQADG